jgi:hypothetical protein
VSLADNTYWAENGILTAASIRRMGDIEYVAELLIGVMHGPQGGASSIIDQYYIQYEDYEDEFPEQHTTQEQFDNTLRAIQDILPDVRSTRWKNKGDFYSLFVALAALLTRRMSDAEAAPIRAALGEFEAEIKQRRLDDTADVSADVGNYLDALQRGANDKGRRADRHEALLHVLQPVMP